MGISLTGKSHVVVLLLFVWAVVLSIPGTSPVQAAVVVSEFNDGKGRFEAEGNVAIRYANWNWFESEGGFADNDYDYFFTRTRFGV